MKRKQIAVFKIYILSRCLVSTQYISNTELSVFTVFSHWMLWMLWGKYTIMIIPWERNEQGKKLRSLVQAPMNTEDTQMQAIWLEPVVPQISDFHT